MLAFTSQSQSQPQKKAVTIDDSSEDEDAVQRKKPQDSRRKQPKINGRRFHSGLSEDDGDTTASQDVDSDDWDPIAAYREFTERKTLKRKRVAAETKRLRTNTKTRAAAATSIIGRKALPKKILQSNSKTSVLSGPEAGTDDATAKNTYLDDPTPEYIEARKRKLKNMHEAGLRYPPSHDDIDFSDDELEEKPILHRDIQLQRPKKEIKLRESGGIVPASIAQWLRDYQVDGVQFLHERFVRQSGAILGDDMGLGKTIQVIAFLTAAFGKSATKRDAKIMRKVRRMGDNRWYPKILIVCPGTLMSNWQDELEKWGWWQVSRYHGLPEDRRGVLGAAKKDMVEIMITTYSTYKNNEGEINIIDWDCVVADECHQLKNPQSAITKAMNRINALCRIGLTGTAIQNRYDELWNLLNWARPGYFGSAQEWRQHVSIPLKAGQAHDATHAQLANARAKAKDLVETILPDVFLRRMKTLIAHQLPKKTDRIVFCQLTDTQAAAYQTFLESDRCDKIRRAKEPCDCLSGKKRGWCCYIKTEEDVPWNHNVFPAMQTLTKLANHIGLLLPRTSEVHEKQVKDLDNLQLAFPTEWKELDRIRDSILNQSQRRFCGKWKVLKKLLDFWNTNGDKVLVFSHSVKLLRLLKALFDLDGTQYNFSYLDGGMPLEARAQAVANFNSDPDQFVFLISTKAGGVGLNITSANKVVVMDPNWNPAYDLQAQDRAYRIGQTRDVEVFRLVSSGTIEEIIYARQIYKQQQANIGYTASDERRYFKGVQDDSSKAGELFGLENLFSFDQTGLLLRDIVHKTNVAETRVGVDALDFNADITDDMFSDEDDDILSNKSLGITDDDDNPDSQMKKIADYMAADETTQNRKKKAASKKAQASDPIHAILAKAGVQYTHKNSEVIGRSSVEAELGRRAMEVRNDADLSRQRVFQSQSQHVHDDDIHDSGEDDVRLLGSSELGKEFKINYRYRPDERVRRRQFCTMAKMMGSEDPVEFALQVEHMTQDERTNMLRRFYRLRRKQLVEDFAAK
jgi:SNF2 family DNA or RNA helicase